MRPGASITAALATIALVIAGVSGTRASFSQNATSTASLTAAAGFGPTLTLAPLADLIGALPFALDNSLSTTDGVWAGAVTINYSYQWQRCEPTCDDISGATSSTYTLVSADVQAGVKVRVMVTATNALNGNQRRAPSAKLP